MLRILPFVSGRGSTCEAVWRSVCSPGGRLHGLVEMVGIAFDQPGRGGEERMRAAGFPQERCFVPKKGQSFFSFQNDVLELAQPDIFCQYGLEKKTESEVLRKHKGVNAHLGPGGQYMLGLRRIWVHLQFCERVGRRLPIPVFCQWVAEDWDKGNAIFVRWEDPFEHGNTVEEIADGLLLIEHEVQIEALYRLALGTYKEQPVPNIARHGENWLVTSLRVASRGPYPKIH